MLELKDKKGQLIRVLSVVHGLGPPDIDEAPWGTRISTNIGIVSNIEPEQNRVEVKWRCYIGDRITGWTIPSLLQIMGYRTIEESLTHAEAEIRELALNYFKQTK